MSQEHSIDPEEVYYGVGGERHGPVDLERIRQLIEHGQLSADDYIWIADAELWVEARDVPQVASLFDAGELRAPPAPPEAAALYAGFWIRFVAHLVDCMVLFLPAMFWFTAALSLAGIDPELLDTEAILLDPWSPANAAAVEALIRFEWIAWGGYWVMDLIYRSLLESSPWQATVGKRIFGLIVTDEYGGRLSLGNAALRHAAKILSAIPFLFGFVMVGFHARKQGLHDIVAKTFVTRRS